MKPQLTALLFLFIALIACNLAPVEQAAQQIGEQVASEVEAAVEEAVEQVASEVEAAVEEAVEQTKNEAETTIQKEADNFVERAINWLDGGVNYVCRLAVFPEEICSDTVKWLYEEPLLGEMDRLSGSQDIMKMLSGKTPNAASLATNAILIYPEISQCATNREEYGLEPCAKAGLSIIGLAGLAAVPLLGLPLLGGAAIFGGAMAAKFLLFR